MLNYVTKLTRYAISRRACQLYLHLRDAGAPDLPGNLEHRLYQLRLEVPILAFGGILAAEAGAVYLSWGFGVSLLLTVLFVIGDFLLALFGARLLYLERITLLEANRVIDDGVATQLRFKARNIRRLRNLTHGGIILNAMIKITLFTLAQEGIETEFLLVAPAFLVAAILHIYYTGDLIVGAFLKLTLRKERNAFQRSGGKEYGVPVTDATTFSIEGKPVPAKAGSHRIQYDAKGQQAQLVMVGNFFDEEVARLIEQQPSPQQRYAVQEVVSVARDTQF